MRLRLSHVFAFNLMLSGLLGLGTLISPVLVFGPLGIDVSATTATMLRVYGGASLGFVAMMWAARPGTANGDLRRATVRAQIFHNVIGFGVTLHGVLTGVSNSLGWINVLLWLLLSLAYLYFEFLGPRSEFSAP